MGQNDIKKISRELIKKESGESCMYGQYNCSNMTLGQTRKMCCVGPTFRLAGVGMGLNLDHIPEQIGLEHLW